VVRRTSCRGERCVLPCEGSDLASLCKLIAQAAVWHGPGASAVSGDHRRQEAIFAYFQKLAELTDGTFHAELIDVLASDMHAAALAAAKGTRGDRVFEQTYLLFLRIENDRIVEARLFNEDEEAFQAFWS